MKQSIKVFCDETCPLQGRDDKIMVLGAIHCDEKDVKIVAEKIRQIKKKHKLSRLFETKWTKISPSKVAYYLEVVDYFFNQSPVKFRGVLVPDKSLLDHDKHNKGSHDEFYYKMYYVMLKWIVRTSNVYHFYIDIKDTKGARRVRHLHDVLAGKFYDYNHECIATVQQIRSHESELMQLADLLIGAIGHANRFERKDTPKQQVVEKIISYLPSGSLSASTPYTYTKFNLFKWDATLP